MSSDKRHAIKRPEGVTTAERYLKKLCDRTFLSLWSYSGIYRDQVNKEHGHGKEICDLIVVFEGHVIIFSDKDCSFPDTGNLELSKNQLHRSGARKDGSGHIPIEYFWIVRANNHFRLNYQMRMSAFTA